MTLSSANGYSGFFSDFMTVQVKYCRNNFLALELEHPGTLLSSETFVFSNISVHKEWVFLIHETTSRYCLFNCPGRKYLYYF